MEYVLLKVCKLFLLDHLRVPIDDLYNYHCLSSPIAILARAEVLSKKLSRDLAERVSKDKNALCTFNFDWKIPDPGQIDPYDPEYDNSRPVRKDWDTYLLKIILTK